ncbi:peptidase S9 prolyl oligopeptidase active site domain-containing protein [Salinarchaeum sp. Harcht-Bsk1]|nr:peptidase S9 prolyl oligopeptidase active site domain-containing protein [Salinarchaeum sp. Harcht-Bsk1]
MPRDDVDETLEALASLPTLAQATVSPDGDRIAFYHDGTGRNELHVLDVATGEVEQWSDGDVPRDSKSTLEWDADGDRMFFHHDQAGNEQFDVYAIDAAGTVESVYESAGQSGLHDVGADGDVVLVGSNHEGQMNLYSHDLDADETTTVTEYERATLVGLLSPDGEQVAFATNESDEFSNVDSYVADADGGNPRNLQIGDTGAECVPADWHPDGDRLLVADNTTDVGRCGIYDLDADEVTWYGEGADEEMAECFLPGGDRFLALRMRDATVTPVIYDVETGESRAFEVPSGVSEFGHGESPVLADGRVVLTHESPTTRPRIIAYDLETDEYDVLREAEYGSFDREDFVDAEYVTFESDGVPETPARAVEHEPYDELEIGALLYDSGERPSPLIVHPHGGPRLHETKNFDVFTQFLASRGYSVLQVNYRGSTGRGREFVERLYDDWGGAEQGDVATAAEHVLETRDWIDEDRVIAYGRSFGGFSAYWQSVQYPDLYDAVISWVGVSDLRDMYENTMPHFRSELMEKYMGDPDENADLYEERSPITHVENVQGPLLMLHGANDTRVPVSQARRFDEALQEAGFEEGPDGDYEYVELDAEGHSSSDVRRKIRVFSLVDDFLDRRL